MGVAQQSKPVLSTTTHGIRVYYSPTQWLVLPHEVYTEQTVGQVLSHIKCELRKQLSPQHLKDVLSVRLKHGTELADYWLTQLDRPFAPVVISNRFPPQFELLYANSKIIAVIKNRKVPQLEDFEVIKMIGRGGFSKVLQVRKKNDGAIYAMKVISKSFVIGKEKVEQIMTEKAILAKISHPFIVGLHYSFHSKHYLFLMLDFCPGGELFYHLHKRVRFPEEVARFYFCEVLLAIEFLHSNNILYRDLKPENILIDIDGHVKLTDFGLSREHFGKNAQTYSFCGSPEYMCPEMLTGAGHGRPMDIYTLGALLYEMLTGLPPHYSQNRQEMYQRIVNDPIEFPPYLSESAVDLLRKLLSNSPGNRLGAKGGIQEIRAHRFFNEIDWSDILAKRVKPPYKLDFKTSYFDPVFTSSPMNWSEGDDVGCERERSQSNFEFICVSATDWTCDSENCDDQKANSCSLIQKKRNNRFEYVKSIVDKADDFDKRAKTDRNKLRFDLIPKAALELFRGYTYSKETANAKKKPKYYLHPGNDAILFFKATSIKPPRASGESNDPTEGLSDIDEEPPFINSVPKIQLNLDERNIVRTLIHHARCASLMVDSHKNLCSNNKDNLPVPLTKQKTFKVKTKTSRTNVAKMLAAAETTKLIRQKQSRAGESLIRLNDAINDVVSERKRGDFTTRGQRQVHWEDIIIKEENKEEIKCEKTKNTERILNKTLEERDEKKGFEKNGLKEANETKNVKRNWHGALNKSSEGKNVKHYVKASARVSGNRLLSPGKCVTLKSPKMHQPVKVSKISLWTLQSSLIRNKSISAINGGKNKPTQQNSAKSYIHAPLSAKRAPDTQNRGKSEQKSVPDYLAHLKKAQTLQSRNQGNGLSLNKQHTSTLPNGSKSIASYRQAKINIFRTQLVQKEKSKRTTKNTPINIKTMPQKYLGPRKNIAEPKVHI